MPVADKTLLQTRVATSVARKLDTLAKTMGHKRAGYLRYLVELHVEMKTPSPHTRGNTKQLPIYPRYNSKTHSAFKTTLAMIIPSSRKQ